MNAGRSGGNLFEDQGFAILERVLTPDECAELSAEERPAGRSTAGTRSLLAEPWCRALVDRLRLHGPLARLLPTGLVAVQCTSFEKSRDANWLVPWHQDLSIPVAERVDHPALRGWSRKEGATFVQPPEALLAEMAAVRLHLDPCGPDDGPLRVAAGSHRLGRIDPSRVPDARRGSPEVACLAGPGDVLVMRPLLLHASSRATGSGRRRVLHFLFGPPEPPFGLRWRDRV
ncbi:phytanoyl-CoA dioxygenase family protein [Paludisphaera soli]|uniref:phytanoyl-CoA dioxygenase family protein n=1 Tax=Paludisphaera soli TaxID=2712865 RepID=UPI0013EABADA|nr:phytanoyl-CoA dioxygenase family protein [Paludisphaera soli]